MFSYVQVGEVMPFIDELLASINSIICDLQPQQVQTFYEAVGHMISARYFFICMITQVFLAHFWSGASFNSPMNEVFWSCNTIADQS